jgi:hypothetical protein
MHALSPVSRIPLSPTTPRAAARIACATNPAVSRSGRPEPRNRLGLPLFSTGHPAVDANPGARPALLPLLLGMHLGYTTAAPVATVGNVTFSIVQPLLGYVSDRVTGIGPARWSVYPLDIEYRGEVQSDRWAAQKRSRMSTGASGSRGGR